MNQRRHRWFEARISRRIRFQKYVRVCIIGLGGEFYEKNLGSEISWDCPFKLKGPARTPDMTSDCTPPPPPSRAPAARTYKYRKHPCLCMSRSRRRDKDIKEERRLIRVSCNLLPLFTHFCSWIAEWACDFKLISAQRQGGDFKASDYYLWRRHAALPSTSFGILWAVQTLI